MSRASRIIWGAAIAALFLFALASCGQGGSAAATLDQAPATPRAGLHMGYYFGCGTYMLEQADHVDVWWSFGLCKGATVWHLGVAEELVAARAAGIRNIVLQLPTTDITELRFQFGRLSDGGYFDGWDSITLYPLDEPGSAQGGAHSDAEVTDIVTRIKQLAFDVPGLFGAHVGVFYGCDDPKPGIKAYDRVGCFRYGSDGCARLEADYADLRRQLAPGAMLWMIPGGAAIGGNDGRQDPACWASYAQRHLDVSAVIGFLWQSVAGNPPLTGIREEATLRKAYCDVGRTILHPTGAPPC